MDENEAREIIKKLTGVAEAAIKVYDDGFLSKGYVIDNGRIVFKFPKKDGVKYDNEVDTLNFINELGLDVNLQKVGWTSTMNTFLGVYGVFGKSIEGKILSTAQQLNIGKQLGIFLRRLHTAEKVNAPRLTLQDEIQEWQKRYRLVQGFLSSELSKNEVALLEKLMQKYLPQTLFSLGERLVFSHGDLGDGNIFVDDNEKIGVIDFNSSGYFDLAADFMDVSDDNLRSNMLDAYGASRDLVSKVELRKDIRPIIVLLPYLESSNHGNISHLVSKVRKTIEKYSNKLLEM